MGRLKPRLPHAAAGFPHQGLHDILANNGFCGEDRFWSISRAIMHDAATSIARFWQAAWAGFVGQGAHGNRRRAVGWGAAGSISVVTGR